MFELFDLENDPHELKNLAGTEDAREIEAELKNRLAEWIIIERDFVPLPIGK